MRQVAEALGVHRATVYKIAASGDLATVRIGEAVRCHPRDLEAFITRSRKEHHP